MTLDNPDRPMDHKSRRLAQIGAPSITLAHGSGGKAMSDLIEDIFLREFGAPEVQEDQARIALDSLVAKGDRLAFTTDSYVVDPLFFPGGDIGTLAVAGTVNDLAVSGAQPLYLSCGFILEEGLPIGTLRQVSASMQKCALEAGVAIVTGDTKVVPHGSADKLFINTAGIGVIRAGLELSIAQAKEGDVVLVNGTLGDHGAAIMNARGDLGLQASLQSDCQPLNRLIDHLVDACPGLRSLRDATRGGVASVLNEIAEASRVGITLNESQIPVRAEVRGVCEILGLDPLYLANEGKLVIVVAPENSDEALHALRSHEAGKDATVIGTMTGENRGMVVMETAFGGRRVVDKLYGEQLPRIC